MEYSLPWDRTTLYWTLGTLGLLLTLTVACLLWYRSTLKTGAPGWPPLAGALTSLAVLAGLLAVAPVGVRLQGTTLEVRRPAGGARYDLRRATSVEVVPYEAEFGPGTLRTFGVGGPFGLVGRFRNPAVGPFRAAVTRRAALVMVRFQDDLPLVLSPASPADLAEALRRARQAATETPSG